MERYKEFLKVSPKPIKYPFNIPRSDDLTKTLKKIKLEWSADGFVTDKKIKGGSVTGVTVIHASS